MVEDVNEVNFHQLAKWKDVITAIEVQRRYVFMLNNDDITRELSSINLRN